MAVTGPVDVFYKYVLQTLWLPPNIVIWEEVVAAEGEEEVENPD